MSVLGVHLPLFVWVYLACGLFWTFISTVSYGAGGTKEESWHFFFWPIAVTLNLATRLRQRRNRR